MNKKEEKTILITGGAGFIGFHLIQKLLNEGFVVIGLDSINNYYDINLKYDRLKLLGFSKEQIEYGKISTSSKTSLSSFIKLNLEDRSGLESLFKSHQIDFVCNLAAQAGVRYSITNPHTYIESNIVGFVNLIECCRYFTIEHFIYASSSSVYGLNKKMPLSTNDPVDHPISLYAATKKSNELMAHTYSHLYDLPTTGLRFFTVYGPWGRPDMALFLFTDAILNNRPINVFNKGDMLRDFTYIDDIVEGLYRVINKKPTGNENWNAETGNISVSTAPYKVYNIGNSNPVRLMDFISAIEESLHKKAEINFLPMQPGDVKMTFADVSDLEEDLNYKPNTSIRSGIDSFVSWYKSYYNN